MKLIIRDLTDDREGEFAGEVEQLEITAEMVRVLIRRPQRRKPRKAQQKPQRPLLRLVRLEEQP